MPSHEGTWLHTSALDTNQWLVCDSRKQNCADILSKDKYFSTSTHSSNLLTVLVYLVYTIIFNSRYTAVNRFQGLNHTW
jgi:hypothetical protein